MPLPYMNQLEAAWERFDQCMSGHGGKTTHFHQFVWLKWHGNPQLMTGVCDPLTLRWLLDRKRRTPSFVAAVMTGAVRQELEHDANQQMHMNQLDQHEYAKEKLTRQGMRFVSEGRVDGAQGDATFLRPIGDLIEMTPACYYYIVISGYHRQLGTPRTHTIGVDGPGRALFDSNAGFATLDTMSQLGDAFCDWAVAGHPELDLRLCTFKSFA